MPHYVAHLDCNIVVIIINFTVTEGGFFIFRIQIDRLPCRHEHTFLLANGIPQENVVNTL